MIKLIFTRGRPLTGLVQKSFKIDASSTNIPTSFSNSNAASLVYSGARKVKSLAIMNYSLSVLKVNYSHGQTESAPTAVDAYVPAAISGGGPGCLVLDNIILSPTLYIASDDSTISSGIVRGFAVGVEL